MLSSRRLNFLRGVLNRGTLSQSTTPKTFVIEPVLTGANVVTFNVSSNMPNQELFFTLQGVAGTDFVENSVNGTFVTDGSGSATITRTLIPDTNLVDGNKKFNAQIRAYSITGEVRAQSSNVLINKFEYPNIAGGTVDFVSGNVKLHTFTANSTLSVLSVGDNANSTLRYLVVGAGGAGGRGFRDALGPLGIPGGGGGGGSVIEGNTTVAISNTAITIGAGGNAALFQNGFPTTFGNITATGGGAGGIPVTYDTASNTSVAHNGVIGANGGGGSGKARRQPGLPLTSLNYYTQMSTGVGGNSDVGGFTGGNAVLYGPQSAASDPQYILSNNQFSTYPTASAGGGGAGAGFPGGNGQFFTFQAFATGYGPPEYTFTYGVGGVGGAGAISDISGNIVRYGGGGGGGYGSQKPTTAYPPATPQNGGDGGGGNGAYWTGTTTIIPAQNGQPNTGGGGGGATGVGGTNSTVFSENNIRGGNGGSGVVRVAYTWDNPRKLALET